MKQRKTARATSMCFLQMCILMFIGCKTVDLEKMAEPRFEGDKTLQSLSEEEERNEKEMHDLLVAEEMKVQDIEQTVVYVEKPVYIPESKASDKDFKRLSGFDAAKDSIKIATKKPEHYKDGTFFYQYDENLVYEIYAQPYHLTDISLEEGEAVQGSVLIAEDEQVWELTANVAQNPVTGRQIQHLFLKPAYANLDTSMVVITDRRVYHFRIKSFNTAHMAMVKFTYPQTRNTWVARNGGATANGVSVENEYMTVTNPEFLSFDYKIKYGFKKPDFLPKRVYDDGQKTYIVVDDIVLHKQLPILFNERNEIANYSVHKNVFMVPRLINKMTLRLGKQKIVIEKKKSRGKNGSSEDTEKDK